jgi:hypothetical protein
LLNDWTIALAGAACALGLLIGLGLRLEALAGRSEPRGGAPVVLSASELCSWPYAGESLRSGKRCGPSTGFSFQVPRQAVRLVGYVSGARFNSAYPAATLLLLRVDSNLSGDGGDSPILKQWTLQEGSQRRIDFRVASQRGRWLYFEPWASDPAKCDYLVCVGDGSVLFRNLRIIGKRR